MQYGTAVELHDTARVVCSEYYGSRGWCGAKHNTKNRLGALSFSASYTQYDNMSRSIFHLRQSCPSKDLFL